MENSGSSHPSSTIKADRTVPWFLHSQRRPDSQFNRTDTRPANMSSLHMPRMPTLWPVFQIPQWTHWAKFSHWLVGTQRVEVKGWEGKERWMRVSSFILYVKFKYRQWVRDQTSGGTRRESDRMVGTNESRINLQWTWMDEGILG